MTLYFTPSLEFLKLGQRVRAKTRVYDLPGEENPGPIHAEVGEEGTCVHAPKNDWPTVRFDRTETATMVTWDEVEAIEADK